MKIMRHEKKKPDDVLVITLGKDIIFFCSRLINMTKL